MEEWTGRILITYQLLEDHSFLPHHRCLKPNLRLQTRATSAIRLIIARAPPNPLVVLQSAPKAQTFGGFGGV